MNIEKLQEELLITSNIMNFDVEDLMRMYAYDEHNCEEFLGTLSDAMILGNSYTMLLFQSYDKIHTLADKCLKEYPENDKINLRSNYLNKVIEIEQKRDESLNDYFEQATGLFENSIGTFKLPNIKGIPQIIFILLKSSYDIDKALSDESSLSDINDLYEKSKDREEVNPQCNYVDSMLNLLKTSNPKFRLCFDVNFLVTANYLIMGYHPGVRVDEDFINLVKEVIDVSLNTKIKKDIPGFDERLYKKVANLTLKNIKSYEKKKNEKEQKTLRK